MPGIVAVHWSLLTRRLAHLSLLPFPVPFRRRPAGQRLMSRCSIHPSARVWTVAAVLLRPVPALLYPTTPPPPRTAATHGGPVRSRNTDGRAEVGRRPGTGGARWSPAFNCTTRKETLRTLLQYYEQFHAVTKLLNTVNRLTGLFPHG